jgi:hypothetical protein
LVEAGYLSQEHVDFLVQVHKQGVELAPMDLEDEGASIFPNYPSGDENPECILNFAYSQAAKGRVFLPTAALDARLDQIKGLVASPCAVVFTDSKPEGRPVIDCSASGVNDSHVYPDMIDMRGFSTPRKAAAAILLLKLRLLLMPHLYPEGA